MDSSRPDYKIFLSLSFSLAWGMNSQLAPVAMACACPGPFCSRQFVASELPASPVSSHRPLYASPQPFLQTQKLAHLYAKHEDGCMLSPLPALVCRRYAMPLKCNCRAFCDENACMCLTLAWMAVQWLCLITSSGCDHSCQ